MNKRKEKAAGRFGSFSVINRSYNTRMRDIYFQKFESDLENFVQKLTKSPLTPDTALLNKFNDSLATSADFARESIAGMPLHALPTSKIKTLSGPPQYFKEEILFINVLEELISSSRFLLNRFNTIHELGEYRKKIRELLATYGRHKGYLSKILEFLDENQKAEDEEIKQIVCLIKERTLLSRRIFDIIKTRKG